MKSISRSFLILLLALTIGTEAWAQTDEKSRRSSEGIRQYFDFDSPAVGDILPNPSRGVGSPPRLFIFGPVARIGAPSSLYGNVDIKGRFSEVGGSGANNLDPETQPVVPDERPSVSPPPAAAAPSSPPPGAAASRPLADRPAAEDGSGSGIQAGADNESRSEQELLGSIARQIESGRVAMLGFRPSETAERDDQIYQVEQERYRALAGRVARNIETHLSTLSAEPLASNSGRGTAKAGAGVTARQRQQVQQAVRAEMARQISETGTIEGFRASSGASRDARLARAEAAIWKDVAGNVAASLKREAKKAGRASAKRNDRSRSRSAGGNGKARSRYQAVENDLPGGRPAGNAQAAGSNGNAITDGAQPGQGAQRYDAAGPVEARAPAPDAGRTAATGGATGEPNGGAAPIGADPANMSSSPTGSQRPGSSTGIAQGNSNSATMDGVSRGGSVAARSFTPTRMAPAPPLPRPMSSVAVEKSVSGRLALAASAGSTLQAANASRTSEPSRSPPLLVAGQQPTSVQSAEVPASNSGQRSPGASNVPARQNLMSGASPGQPSTSIGRPGAVPSTATEQLRGGRMGSPAPAVDRTGRSGSVTAGSPPSGASAAAFRTTGERPMGPRGAYSPAELQRSAVKSSSGRLALNAGPPSASERSSQQMRGSPSGASPAGTRSGQSTSAESCSERNPNSCVGGRGPSPEIGSGAVSEPRAKSQSSGSAPGGRQVGSSANARSEVSSGPVGGNPVRSDTSSNVRASEGGRGQTGGKTPAQAGAMLRQTAAEGASAGAASGNAGQNGPRASSGAMPPTLPWLVNGSNPLFGPMQSTETRSGSASPMMGAPNGGAASGSAGQSMPRASTGAMPPTLPWLVNGSNPLFGPMQSTETLNGSASPIVSAPNGGATFDSAGQSMPRASTGAMPPTLPWLVNGSNPLFGPMQSTETLNGPAPPSAGGEAAPAAANPPSSVAPPPAPIVNPDGISPQENSNNNARSRRDASNPVPDNELSAQKLRTEVQANAKALAQEINAEAKLPKDHAVLKNFASRVSSLVLPQANADSGFEVQAKRAQEPVQPERSTLPLHSRALDPLFFRPLDAPPPTREELELHEKVEASRREDQAKTDAFEKQRMADIARRERQEEEDSKWIWTKASEALQNYWDTHDFSLRWPKLPFSSDK